MNYSKTKSYFVRFKRFRSVSFHGCCWLRCSFILGTRLLLQSPLLWLLFVLLLWLLFVLLLSLLFLSWFSCRLLFCHFFFFYVSSSVSWSIPSVASLVSFPFASAVAWSVTCLVASAVVFSWSLLLLFFFFFRSLCHLFGDFFLLSISFSCIFLPFLWFLSLYLRLFSWVVIWFVFAFA